MSKSKKNKNKKATTYVWPATFKEMEPYVYKGKLNETGFPEFIKLCKMTQKELKEYLPTELSNAGYEDVIVADGFIYAKGENPILLTAHMDTVHNEPVKDFYEEKTATGNHILRSPQGIGGDDRCGIYMILEVIKANYKPSILFCEDEEIGGVGAGKFCKTDYIYDLSHLNFLVELDRKGNNDAVFYECDNPKFTEFIENVTKYTDAFGSYSDICELAPTCGIAAVNLSCGYYNAHTLKEEVVMEEMFHTIDVVKDLLDAESEQFEYIERDYGYDSWYGGRYGKWDGWYGGYSSGYGNSSNSYNDYVSSYYGVTIEIMYADPDTGKEVVTEVYGSTEAEAWVEFFQSHPDVSFNMVYDWDVYN